MQRLDWRLQAEWTETHKVLQRALKQIEAGKYSQRIPHKVNRQPEGIKETVNYVQ